MYFLKFFAMHWFPESGGGIKRFLMKCAFSGLYSWQALKFFKSTFWTIFSEKKFFLNFFSDVLFEISRDVLVFRGGEWYETLFYKVGLQRIIVRQAVKFFKPTFWTIFSEKNFFLFFFQVYFLKFLAMYWFLEAGSGIKRFLYKMGLQRIIVRQAVKFFKPTFWTIFSEKNFFLNFFWCIFWNFSRCIGFQRRGVVSNAFLWSGLSAG